MAKVTDLTGLKFGQLTILERDWNYVKEHNLKQNRPYWKCKCDCGTIFSICGGSLTRKNGYTRCKKCGDKTKIKDLIGQKFGYLTVLEKSKEQTKDRHVRWVCKCKCGNTIIVRNTDLTQGHTKSCGCFKHEQAIHNLIGQRFNKLLVLKNVPSPDNKKYKCSYWLCQCDCGNQIIVSENALTTKNTQSCGCMISIGENKIKQLLKDNNINFIQQKTFNTCRFPNTNYLAKFDFYINNSFLLEFDGRQHYIYSNTGWNTKENYNKTIQRDIFKNNWCKENNIILKRIPYWKLSSLTIEDIMGEEFIYKEEVKKDVQS